MMRDTGSLVNPAACRHLMRCCLKDQAGSLNPWVSFSLSTFLSFYHLSGGHRLHRLALNSWTQMILLSQPLKQLGLQACAVVPGFPDVSYWKLWILSAPLTHHLGVWSWVEKCPNKYLEVQYWMPFVDYSTRLGHTIPFIEPHAYSVTPSLLGLCLSAEALWTVSGSWEVLSLNSLHSQLPFFNCIGQ